jgi:hypothetical protein
MLKGTLAPKHLWLAIWPQNAPNKVHLDQFVTFSNLKGQHLSRGLLYNVSACTGVKHL